MQLLQQILTKVAQRSSGRKAFSELLQNSQKYTCARTSFLIKLQAEAWNFIKKETLTQVLSSEFGKISKNTFSYRTPLVAACEFSRISFTTFIEALRNDLQNFLWLTLNLQGLQLYQKETPTQVFFCEIWKIFNSIFFYRKPPVAASAGLYIISRSVFGIQLNINPFLANVLILYPWKHQKTLFCFLVLSGGIKWEHWPQMGYWQAFLQQFFCSKFHHRCLIVA